MEWNQVSVKEMEQRVARWNKLDVIPIQKVLPPELNRELIADQVFGVVTSNLANDPQNFFDTAPIHSGVGGMAYTYENFMPLSGSWRIYWGDRSEHHLDLEQWDTLSVPPGAMRRFKNLSDERAHMLVMAYGEGKLDNDIYVPPEEIDRLRKQFGDQYGEMIDRIQLAQATPTWTKPE